MSAQAKQNAIHLGTSNPDGLRFTIDPRHYHVELRVTEDMQIELRVKPTKEDRIEYEPADAIFISRLLIPAPRVI